MIISKKCFGKSSTMERESMTAGIDEGAEPAC